MNIFSQLKLGKQLTKLINIFEYIEIYSMRSDKEGIEALPLHKQWGAQQDIDKGIDALRVYYPYAVTHALQHSLAIAIATNQPTRAAAIETLLSALTSAGVAAAADVGF